MKDWLNSFSLKISDSTRVQWLYFVASSGLLLGILLTPPQWSAVRTYPLVPIIPNLAAPAVFHTLLLVSSILALISGLFLKRYRLVSTSIVLISVGGLALLDITRFHPWILHYLAVLLLFSFFIKKSTNHTWLLDAARIIVGGIYFWSGVQKLNPYLVTTVFPWLTQPFWEYSPALLLNSFIFLGLFVPWIEAGFALGLFTKKYRTVSVIGSTFMILLVLTALGPLGHDWNSSVWPWNIAIFSMVIVLFYKTTFSVQEFLQRIKKSPVALIMIAVFWLLPLGNVVGYVDGYLAWSLYSGHVPEATLYGDQLLLETLSPAAKNGVLPFVDWTISEMNQIPYPAQRVFESIFLQTCERFNNDSSLQLEVTTPEYFNTLKRPKTVYSCL